MEDKLMDILAEVLEVEKNSLNLDTNFKHEKFSFDSLKGFAILVMIEDEFEINIPADDFVKIEKISELLDYIKEVK
ncbi:MAG: acyl carrier protein [Clostridiales Family XIII bacterium]|jgi:acyl carrier protein|nr:acyl carrier protein [Clostridiales Family XIII bacterium]